MNKNVKMVLSKIEKELERYSQRPDIWEKEIEEKQTRIKEIKRLWRKYGNTPLVQQMNAIAEKKIEHYHQDFYYHDLRMLQAHEGRFAWIVGDCGTHFVRLDNETMEEEENQKGWLKAVERQRSDYDLYECDTVTGTMKKTKFEKIQFKIVKPMEVPI